MAKKPTSHPYADQLAFERIMLLIATLVHHPGVGGADEESCEGKHRDALQAVQAQLRDLATSYNVPLPEGYPATPTLRKDLEILRRYGILDRRMYRHGYYLGTGVMSREELKVALNALESLAKYQGDPRVRQIYQTLCQRLRGWDGDGKGEFLYPVRSHFNRPIIHTDPFEMMAKGKNRHTLFHSIDLVEGAIVQGQSIEIYCSRDPYQNRIGYQQVWPLQLLYHDIAWYLLYEECHTHHLSVVRVDRYSDRCIVLDPIGRGIAAQLQSLQEAHHLLKTGWGLHLGNLEEQQLERAGKQPFEEVKVRFFPPVTTFILEGECRHPNQEVRAGKKDSTGQPSYVDYTIKLPPRSFDEFVRWVYRYMENAIVLSPPALVERHRQAAQALVSRYNEVGYEL